MIPEHIKQTLIEVMGHDGSVTFDGDKIFHNGKLVGLFEDLQGCFCVHQEEYSFWVNPFYIPGLTKLKNEKEEK